MLDSSRYMNKAGFGNRHLFAVDDQIDFRSQIIRIVHITADKAEYLIVVRMAVFGMNLGYGAYHPHGFHVERSRDNSVVNVDHSPEGIFIRRLGRIIASFEIVDSLRHLKISAYNRLGFDFGIYHT